MSTEEKWPELLDMMGSLGEKLDRIIGEASQKALPDYAAGIVLNETPQPVNLHAGYKFNYLLVSSEAASAMGSSNVLTVNIPGMTYTQPIYEGLNPLNIKGSSAKLSVAGLSGYYPAEFVQTNESPVVQSAGMRTIAGSLVPQTQSSTDVALGANAVLTSKTFMVSAFDKIVGSVYADQTGTLDVNQSYDGTHWDVQSSITVSASTPTGFNISVVAPYAQLVYTNGATAQTVFRLHVGGKTL